MHCDINRSPGSGPVSVTHNETVYYYVTNLQGDIVAILNTSGTAVITYSYDAWGNLLSTGGSLASTLGELNPLRYRGYVFDTFSGFYYLQSRYYCPETGRFLNVDAYASTGQGIIGNNMFAYCNNNPIVFVDPFGHALRNNTVFINDGAGKWPVTLADTTKSEENAKSEEKTIIQDVYDYVMNDDEQKVLNAEHFNFYKGAPVVKVDIEDEAAFSFGIIFMDVDVTNPELLKHEYGHCQHLSQIGMVSYASTVVVPSLIGYYSGVPKDYYFLLPWEYIGDYLGNAEQENDHETGGTKILAALYWAYTRIVP